ncbi:RSP_7527 family protein [uncultured Jannaschia sp.]|nr:hypothetical protein [uncultured Jannaschia sp.]
MTDHQYMDVQKYELEARAMRAAYMRELGRSFAARIRGFFARPAHA